MSRRPGAKGTDGPGEGRFAVLSLRTYQLYLLARALSVSARTAISVTVAWQVYAISSSALNLSLIGAVQLTAALTVSLVAGPVSDTYDRRRVVVAAQAVPLLCASLLAATDIGGRTPLLLLYAVAFATAAALPFETPARQALLPSVVPENLFVRALTLNAIFQSVAVALGPVFAGWLIAMQGPGPAYVASSIALLVSMAALLLLRLPAVTQGGRAGVSLQAVKEGFAYVRQSPILLGAMTLDMFAVIFGGAKALLPLYAVDVLRIGPEGYGLLNGALQAGGLVAALLMMALPVPGRTGRTLILSVAGFGVATILFGLSPWFPLSVAAYVLVGMTDQLSVVMRQTIIQLATPDELRGRVTAVNAIFVDMSNNIGAVESGAVAAATNAVFSVVSGGVAVLAVAGAIRWRFPQLWGYRAAR